MAAPILLPSPNERCFACGKLLRRNARLVDTRDDQFAYVGPDCYAKVLAAGEDGYRPDAWLPRITLRLYVVKGT